MKTLTTLASDPIDGMQVKRSNKDLAQLLTSAASALNHGRLATASKKVAEVHHELNPDTPAPERAVLIDAIDEADVAFVCINICSDLTPQARVALSHAWAKVQAAILMVRPHGAEAEAIRSPGTSYSTRQLLEEYLRRRNDSAFDQQWDEFDKQVTETLR
jgi:hypothetical protein